MKILHLQLLGRIPSKKNSRHTQRSTGRSFSSPKHAAWEKEAGYQLIQHKGLNIQKANIQVQFYFPDNRVADLSNKLESIMDVLVKMEIIKDDCWQVINQIFMRSMGVDKENPRVDIWINQTR